MFSFFCPCWLAAVSDLNWVPPGHSLLTRSIPHTLTAHEPHSLTAVRVTLLLVVFRQSFHLGVKPLEPHDQRLFLQPNPYATSSLTRRYLGRLWIGLALSSIRILVAHVACYWKFFLLDYIKVLWQSGYGKQIITVLLILCFNGRLVTVTVVSLTATKFKPHIFSACRFTLSYAVHMFIIMILYDFYLLPAQFCYIVIYLQKVESRVQIMDWCAPWKIFCFAENPVLWALEFWEVAVCHKFSGKHKSLLK
jgi:hypothetical protein